MACLLRASLSLLLLTPSSRLAKPWFCRCVQPPCGHGSEKVTPSTTQLQESSCDWSPVMTAVPFLSSVIGLGMDMWYSSGQRDAWGLP